MHISSKYKYIAYLFILTGFIMIAVIFMRTKNKVQSSSKSDVYLVERSGSTKMHGKKKAVLLNPTNNKEGKIEKKINVGFK